MAPLSIRLSLSGPANHSSPSGVLPEKPLYADGNYLALKHFQEHFPDFHSNSSSLVTAVIRKVIDQT